MSPAVIILNIVDRPLETQPSSTALAASSEPISSQAARGLGSKESQDHADARVRENEQGEELVSSAPSK